MKVVCDTNVLISAVLFSGPPRRILESLIDGKIKGYVSPPIMAELRGVLGRRKFALTPPQVERICGEINDLFETVVPRQRVQVVRADPDDNAILACALEAGADAVISGDPHLLDLATFRGIRILSPAAFLQRWSAG